MFIQLFASILNGLGGLLQGLGLRPKLLPSPPKEAPGDGGTDRDGPLDNPWVYPQALALAAKSLEEEANLSPLGHLILRRVLKDMSQQAQRLAAVRAAHPEIFAADLVPPLIILGPPRSGTTLLS